MLINSRNTVVNEAVQSQEKHDFLKLNVQELETDNKRMNKKDT